MFNLRPLTELVKYERNPRRIDEVSMVKLIQSIRDNGDYFNARPLILSDRTGELVIIAGNQRYEAAKFLELDVVPTYLIKGLTEKKEQEIVIRDNVSNGEWNMDELHNAWNTDDLADWGLNIAFPEEEEPADEQPTIERPIIKLEYSQEDYDIVKQQLSKIDSSPEHAVWLLLGNK